MSIPSERHVHLSRSVSLLFTGTNSIESNSIVILYLNHFFKINGECEDHTEKKVVEVTAPALHLTGDRGHIRDSLGVGL